MYKKISQFLCYVLRHNPDIIGINVDDYGYVDVAELITKVREFGKEISIEILEELVATDEKGRYAYNEDHTRICCVQGHSIPIIGTLQDATPPDILYHGTATRFLDAIFIDGLKPMTRNYVHLSIDIETASKVGKRHGKLAILEVDCKQMVEDGYLFKVAKNGVWQIKDVPVKYIKQTILK